MIHKSKSLPNYLNKITHSLKNSKTFHDFNIELSSKYKLLFIWFVFN